MFVFDFDGVLFDTNKIKRFAIHDAVYSVTRNMSTTQAFVSYFVQNNGIPRETKVVNFFKDDINRQIKILHLYEKTLSELLKSAKPTEGSLELLQSLHELNCDLFILSGGSRLEIIDILDRFNLLNYFKHILTGPVDKLSNAREHLIGRDCIMIGDSLIDYEVSHSMGWEFYFMTDYSDLSIESQPKNAKKITNLKEMHEKIKSWN